MSIFRDIALFLWLCRTLPSFGSEFYGFFTPNSDVSWMAPTSCYFITKQKHIGTLLKSASAQMKTLVEVYYIKLGTASVLQNGSTRTEFLLVPQFTCGYIAVSTYVYLSAYIYILIICINIYISIYIRSIYIYIYKCDLRKIFCPPPLGESWLRPCRN